ncbi:hypothetical protein [Virgibacillus phage Mimir87]|nr:hypothetical protein [Virgibacillus phage Mimir87]
MSKNLMGLDFNIDENAIGEVVKTVVQSSIVEALGSKEQLVEQAVKTMLSTKVNEDGKEPRYSSDKKYNLIEYHVQKAVSGLLKELVAEMLEENREAFKKEFRKQLSSNRSIESFTKSMIDGTVENLNNRWSPSMTINFNEKDEY